MEEQKDVCQFCLMEILEGEKINIITEDGVKTICNDCDEFMETLI